MVFTKEQYLHLMSLIQPKGPLTAAPPASQTPPNSKTSITPSKMSGKIMLCNDIPADFLKSNNISWIIDSGATDHMVCSPSFFTSNIAEVSYRVSLPNKTFVSATHLGSIQLTDKIVLDDVLCIPSFSFNLISVKRLTENLNCCLVFINNTCFIHDLSTWTTIGIAEVRSGLYHLLLRTVSPSSLADLLSCLSPNFPSVVIFVQSSIDVIDIWHCCLGHISDSRMKLIDDPAVRNNLLINKTSPCCICPLAKQHRLPFPISAHKSSTIFELVQCDNQAAIHIASNPVFHEHTKHIELNCHLIRDKILEGSIVTIHVPTHLQQADLLTKALPSSLLGSHLLKLGIVNLHSPSCGGVLRDINIPTNGGTMTSHPALPSQAQDDR